jgi:predicted extracellular nuclease
MIKKCLLLTGWVLSCLFSLNAYGQVVISQVYGGGGNTGATYTHDFIELFNRGSVPVALNGLSLQYASATGTGNFGASASQLTELPNITLQPGQYYLVQQASNANVGAALPGPDLTDSSPISMAAGAGKVALVTGTTSLGCNGGSAPCNTEATARILDLVGYGTGTSGANYFEGSASAPTISATTAAIRGEAGCKDTNNNAADFATGTPAPRNSSTTANPCSGTGERTNPAAAASASPATLNTGAQTLFTVTVTPGANPASSGISVIGDLSAIGGQVDQPLFDDATNGDATAGDNVFSYQATVTASITAGTKTIPFHITDAQGRTATASANLNIQNPDAITAIYTIQGIGAVSPLVGQTVTTQGVVVGDFQASGQFNGFFIQDATGDGNAATSDGIFVASNTAVSVGQIVRVTGPVREPFTQTQIGGTAGDNVTVAVQPGSATIVPATISLPVSTTGHFEQYEGMLVTFPQMLTVSQNFTLGRFGEVWLSADLEYPFNEADGRLYNPTNYIDPTDNPASGVNNNADNKAAVAERQDLHNRSSILLDDASNVQNPAAIPYLGSDNMLRVGSTTSTLTGVVHYAFSTYRIQPTETPIFSYALRPLTPPSTGDANLKIASFNVLNYFNGNGTGQEGSAGGFPTPRGASSLTEFNRQRAKIIAALKELDADVVGLIEMENDGDGENSAIADLVRGLNEATACRYLRLCT